MRALVCALALLACDAPTDAGPPVDAVAPLVDGRVPDAAAATDATPLDAASDAAPELDAAVPGCVDDDTFFAEAVVPLLQFDCFGCHRVGGFAQRTRHVLRDFDEPGAVAQNHETLRQLVLEGDDPELLLKKPTAQVSHGGGRRFGEGDPEYAVLAEFIARTLQPGGCDAPPPPVRCDDGIPRAGPTPLRRLTDQQLRWSVADVFGVDVPPGLFPETTLAGEFRTWVANNNVSAAGAESLLLAAEYVGVRYESGCADAGCARAVLLALARDAFRRPLVDAEAELVTGYVDAGVGPEEAVRMGIELMLQTPQFLYVDPGPGDHAIAARLALFLTDSGPDAALAAAADAGEVHTRAQVAAHAARLLEGDAALRPLTAFHRDWLRTWQLRDATRDPALYPDFSPRTVASMLTALDLFVGEVVWGGDARLETLLFSRDAWIDPELAAIYGLPDPGPGWHRVQLDPSRPGALTRAAFLAAHAYAGSSSPIRRGAFVLKDLLCEDLSPPADVDLDIPEPTEEARTIRERLEQHWTDPACRACHERIDPLGFSFEHFGALGEWRDTWANGIAVDAAGTLDDPAGEFDGARSMIELVGRSERVRACYARRWFEYAVGRAAHADDRCSLERLDARLEASDGDLRALLVDVTLTDAFLARRAGEAE